MNIPIKRWLLLTHRWLGIGTCLLFFLWFLSLINYVLIKYLCMQYKNSA